MGALGGNCSRPHFLKASPGFQAKSRALSPRAAARVCPSGRRPRGEGGRPANGWRLVLRCHRRDGGVRAGAQPVPPGRSDFGEHRTAATCTRSGLPHPPPGRCVPPQALSSGGGEGVSPAHPLTASLESGVSGGRLGGGGGRTPGEGGVGFSAFSSSPSVHLLFIVLENTFLLILKRDFLGVKKTGLGNVRNFGNGGDRGGSAGPQSSRRRISMEWGGRGGGLNPCNRCISME